MTCTFFGHKDAPKAIEPILRSALIYLIETKGVNKFYVGNNGRFDTMAASILHTLSSSYPIQYFVVQPYIPVKETIHAEHTLLPDGIETVPPRFAIPYRNKWMIVQSDYVVTYITHSWGGAAKYADTAKRKGKICIDCNSFHPNEKHNT